MSQGPKIKEWVKWYIRTEALRNRSEPRDSVAERVEAFLKDKEPIPSRDTINKMISKARNSDDTLDGIWTVVDIAHNPIPPEALHTVLKVWASERGEGHHLTIRQALWVSRLYHLFCMEPGFVEAFEIPALAESARTYASLEKAIKLSDGQPVSSQDRLKLWEVSANDLMLQMRVMESDDWRETQRSKKFARAESIRSRIDELKKKQQRG